MRIVSRIAVSLLVTVALAACAVDDVTYTPDPICGNGEAELGEGCDDGNLVDGDGCDRNCTSSACGNTVVSPNEGCDDGNLVDGDGCDSNCTASRCGNAVRAANEKCDDGNQIDGDGCESTCKVTGSGNYEATSDAMVRTSTDPADASTNYGTAPQLFTYGSSFDTVARSYIQFDLTAIPPGSTLESAHLHVRMLDQAGIDFSIEVREVLGPWLETAVTWETQPPFGPTIEASLPFQGYTWWRFDVTALVQRWIDMSSTEVSVVLIQNPEFFANGGQYAHFGSREGMYRPYLEITVAP